MAFAKWVFAFLPSIKAFFLRFWQVVSARFFKRKWCLFELQIAHLAATMSFHVDVIPIFSKAVAVPLLGVLSSC